MQISSLQHMASIYRIFVRHAKSTVFWSVSLGSLGKWHHDPLFDLELKRQQRLNDGGPSGTLNVIPGVQLLFIRNIGLIKRALFYIFVLLVTTISICRSNESAALSFLSKWLFICSMLNTVVPRCTVGWINDYPPSTTYIIDPFCFDTLLPPGMRISETF